jgi:hypothetical protein
MEWENTYTTIKLEISELKYLQRKDTVQLWTESLPKNVLEVCILQFCGGCHLSAILNQ